MKNLIIVAGIVLALSVAHADVATTSLETVPVTVSQLEQGGSYLRVYVDGGISDDAAMNPAGCSATDFYVLRWRTSQYSAEQVYGLLVAGMSTGMDIELMVRDNECKTPASGDSSNPVFARVRIKDP